jgi:hypothetical protein
VQHGHEAAPGGLLQVHRGGVDPDVVEPGGGVEHGQGREQGRVAADEGQRCDAEAHHTAGDGEERAPPEPV